MRFRPKSSPISRRIFVSCMAMPKIDGMRQCPFAVGWLFKPDDPRHHQADHRSHAITEQTQFVEGSVACLVQIHAHPLDQLKGIFKRDFIMIRGIEEHVKHGMIATPRPARRPIPPGRVFLDRYSGIHRPSRPCSGRTNTPRAPPEPNRAGRNEWRSRNSSIRGRSRGPLAGRVRLIQQPLANQLLRNLGRR